MNPFIKQAQVYASYHQKKATLYTHLVGIPILMLSLMILLGFFHIVLTGVFDINAAVIATFILLIYYFRLYWPLALALTPVLGVLLWLASFLSASGPTSSALWTVVILFLLGCAMQGVGHFIEEKRPAFTEHLWQIVIAPLFMVGELFFILGKMTELKSEIYGKSAEKSA